MNVKVFWREANSTPLIVSNADGVDVGPSGDLRLYKRGLPDVQVGAVASNLWKYYVLTDEVEAPPPEQAAQEPVQEEQPS